MVLERRIKVAVRAGKRREEFSFLVPVEEDTIPELTYWLANCIEDAMGLFGKPDRIEVDIHSAEEAVDGEAATG